MTYECDLEVVDYRAFRKHVRYRYHKYHWQYVACLLVFLAIVWFGGKEGESTQDKIYLLVGSLFFFVVMFAVLMGAVALFQHLTGSRFRGPLGRHVFEVSTGGVKETNDFGTNETLLAGIKAVDETSGHFFIVTRSGVGYIIPKRGHSDFGALHELRCLLAQRKR